jgi:hypothetical protein
LVQNDGNDVATVAGMVEPALPESSSGPAAGQTLAAWLNLSHELRTPANAILGQAELLASGGGGPMSADMRAGIGTIQAAGRALLGRIEQLIRLGEELRMAASPMPDASAGPAPDASEAADLVALIRAGWTGGGLQVRLGFLARRIPEAGEEHVSAELAAEEFLQLLADFLWRRGGFGFVVAHGVVSVESAQRQAGVLLEMG